MDNSKHIELVVDSEFAGSRLDNYLSSQLSLFSRSRIQQLIVSGQVKIDTGIVKSGMKLKGKETIVITVPPDIALDIVAENIPLDVVYEDEYLLVINKPVGMVTHPGAGNYQGTLVNALLHHCKNSLSGISGVLRPGIVHRLDKDTSGLLVVAKQDISHHSLSEQIRTKTARRSYIALVEGRLAQDAGVIDKPIGRHPKNRKQMSIVETGRRAVTHFQVLERYAAYTLLSVLLETGRTHQIRVHLSNLGYPIVGDIVYNLKKTGSLKARAKLGLSGHALHAHHLSFHHPVSNVLLQFEAPLPVDFQKLVDSLK